MKTSLLILALLTASVAGAQKTESLIGSGNEQYRAGNYSDAESKYRAALKRTPGNHIAKYNQALSIYKQDHSDSAISIFDIITADQGGALRAQSFYNKGAILSAQKKLEASIEAYKHALRLNPNDQQARENLQKALLELKKKNPPPKQENKKKNESPKKQPPRPQLNQRQAEQKLKDLQQKEQKTQQRMQKKPTNGAGMERKDW